MLLCHAQPSLLQSKRSHDQMRTESPKTTFQQQIRLFNSLTTDVSLPTRNPLQSIPSLQHLSSTQSELENSNVNYSGFDIDLSAAHSTDDELITDDIPTPPPVIEKCSFQRNTIRLPPDIAFQVHLMSQLNEHRGNDLNMFNQIIQCIKAHAVHHDVEFNTLQILSRKQLVQFLTRYYKLDFLKPTLHSVPLSDGTVATMTIFDVKALLIAFLNNPLKMRDENFASNYDIFSGKAKIPTSTIDEIHTGSLWEPARKKYCGDDPDAFPLALVCFYDKTNTDVFGSLSCAPFICTPSFLNRDCRNDDSNYLVLGYVPNLGYGKGTAKSQTSEMKLQDEHDCLSLITNQITKIHNEGGFWTKVMGRRVCVKVWIHLIAGDTLGHNTLVGHFNGGLPKYIYRDCKCLFDELSSPIPSCSLISLEEMQQARKIQDGLTNLCKKNVTNAFEKVPLGDDVYGLLGCVPAEMLHVSGTGLLKYMFGCLEGLISLTRSRKKDRESFDDLHRCLVSDAQRQSERDFPRMSIRNGITDGTKMCGSERVGNCFVLLCAMHTQLGQSLLAKEMRERRISLRKFIYCLKLYLSFERWVNESHPRSQINRSRKLLGELITLIKECFPRTEGWGWNLPKMHAFAKMPHYMLKFGSANNFSGQIGERALKGIVKDHAERTQRRPDNFAEQCAIREYESNVIKYVMTDLSHQLGLSGPRANRGIANFDSRGKFTVCFSKTNSKGIGISPDTIIWLEKKKEKLKLRVSDLFIFAIRRFSHVNGYTDEFKVTGYTTYKVKDNSKEDSVKYYATEYMNGGKRYDYAMINFVSDEGMTETCPSKILGFVRYNITKGIPTPQFLGNEELSSTTTRDNHTVDNNLYVVVHTSSDYMSLEKLQDEFISSFSLGNITDCVYIVNVDAIQCPLFVFKNYGSTGEDRNTLFCTLPQAKWGQYFSERI